MKTARFKDIVARAGRPHSLLIWGEPASDRTLQAALKQNRVLTVYQTTRGSKKDYGVVGLEISPHAQYLVFPKSLQSLADRRVVGIDYELLEDQISSGSKLPPRTHSKGSAKETNPKIVNFERPSPAAAAAMPVKSTPAPPLRAIPVKEVDPLKLKIREAIEDLKAGHFVKARRRLEALLKKG